MSKAIVGAGTGVHECGSATASAAGARCCSAGCLESAGPSHGGGSGGGAKGSDKRVTRTLPRRALAGRPCWQATLLDSLDQRLLPEVCSTGSPSTPACYLQGQPKPNYSAAVRCRLRRSPTSDVVGGAAAWGNARMPQTRSTYMCELRVPTIMKRTRATQHLSTQLLMRSCSLPGTRLLTSATHQLHNHQKVVWRVNHTCHTPETIGKNNYTSRQIRIRNLKINSKIIMFRFAIFSGTNTCTEQHTFRHN